MDWKGLFAVVACMAVAAAVVWATGLGHQMGCTPNPWRALFC